HRAWQSHLRAIARRPYSLVHTQKNGGRSDSGQRDVDDHRQPWAVTSQSCHSRPPGGGSHAAQAQQADEGTGGGLRRPDRKTRSEQGGRQSLDGRGERSRRGETTSAAAGPIATDHLSGQSQTRRAVPGAPPAIARTIRKLVVPL